MGRCSMIRACITCMMAIPSCVVETPTWSPFPAKLFTHARGQAIPRKFTRILRMCDTARQRFGGLRRTHTGEAEDGRKARCQPSNLKQAASQTTIPLVDTMHCLSSRLAPEQVLSLHPMRSSKLTMDPDTLHLPLCRLTRTPQQKDSATMSQHELPCQRCRADQMSREPSRTSDRRPHPSQRAESIAPPGPKFSVAKSCLHGTIAMWLPVTRTTIRALM